MKYSLYIYKLLSIAKLQNLKAIHNKVFCLILQNQLLSIAKLQNLKAIHNGGKYCYKFSAVVINRKTTKFESNSQRKALNDEFDKGCYQSQNYKI